MTTREEEAMYGWKQATLGLKQVKKEAIIVVTRQS